MVCRIQLSKLEGNLHPLTLVTTCKSVIMGSRVLKELIERK